MAVDLLGSTLTQAEKESILKTLPAIKAPKVVLVFAMNDTDQSKFVTEVAQNFASVAEQKQCKVNGVASGAFGCQIHLTFGADKHPALKPMEPIILVNCPRDLDTFLGYLKVADVVIGMSTYAHVDAPNLNKMPEDAIRIIDDLGNQAISLMRAQGQPPFLSVVTDLEQLDRNKHKDAKFYARRLIGEEFGKESECHIVERQADILKVLLDLHKRKQFHPVWRNERGYFLTDSMELVDTVVGQTPTKAVRLSGYLRNSWGPENLGHITGLGDFQSVQVEASLEAKGKVIARMVKVPTKSDDWRVLNDRSGEMDLELSKPSHTEPIPEEDNDDEMEMDELADLRNEFQQLRITSKDGRLTRGGGSRPGSI